MHCLSGSTLGPTPFVGCFFFAGSAAYLLSALMRNAVLLDQIQDSVAYEFPNSGTNLTLNRWEVQLSMKSLSFGVAVIQMSLEWNLS